MFNLEVGRNECSLDQKTITLDFTFDLEPHTLQEDQVVLKWGVFSSAASYDIRRVSGSGLLSFFNTMAFGDVYSDRSLLFFLNTVSWIASMFWIFGTPVQIGIQLFFFAYLFIKFFECLSLSGSADNYAQVSPEQVELFSE